MHPLQIDAERQAVVAEALSWVGTPFHHFGKVKGAGVDCAQLLAETFVRVGLIRPPIAGYYPADWHLHRDAERYLNQVLIDAVEMPLPAERTPEPGDVVLFRFGRCFSHGALVTGWPVIVHAYVGKPVLPENILVADHLRYIGENIAERGRPRPMRVFTLKRWVD
jgi:cell wall-associated NlpC family hydrolase